MARKTIALLAVAAIFVTVALPLASAGTRSRTKAGTASCTVSGNEVEAWNLPTDAVLNFMFTDDDGKHGWGLGFTWDGTWSVSVPDRTGPTTYEFTSTTFGKDGSKYWVYASCSVS
jgi:hypothetical protein